jgi:hypothetical protein
VRSTAYVAATTAPVPGCRGDVQTHASAPTRWSAQSHPSVQIIGTSRPSAVRALLARSVTVTAFAIERRIRMLRRHPSTPALAIPSLEQWRERQAARARYDVHTTQAAAARGLSSLR